MQNQVFSNKSDGQGKTWSDKMLAKIKGIWPKFSVELSSGEYGTDLDQMDSEFTKPLVEEAINRLKRSQGDDPPSLQLLWDSCREVRNGRVGGSKLYDEHCPNCEEGWETVGFSYFGPNRRNNMIKLYGFQEAQKLEAKIRCRVCWKGRIQ
jgi:hypothetical protein